jgi:thiol peroxidase
MERTGKITFLGTPLTLIGEEARIGEKAQDFTVLDKELKEVRFKDFSGKIKCISVTPSLDTPVCDIQARRFNQEAAALPDDVVILNISMDLPFAISRFCTAAGIDKVQTYSDHRDASFGNAFGVLIKELRLLARAIFIIDRDDVIKYIEFVPELSHHPDYERAFSELKKLI